jgi:hypothetical protein
MGSLDWKGESIPVQPGYTTPGWTDQREEARQRRREQEEEAKRQYPETPAKGPIEYPSPPAQTQEEVQASWHKAKNIRPVIKKVKS